MSNLKPGQNDSQYIIYACTHISVYIPHVELEAWTKRLAVLLTQLLRPRERLVRKRGAGHGALGGRLRLAGEKQQPLGRHLNSAAASLRPVLCVREGWVCVPGGLGVVSAHALRLGGRRTRS